MFLFIPLDGILIRCSMFDSNRNDISRPMSAKGATVWIRMDLSRLDQSRWTKTLQSIAATSGVFELVTLSTIELAILTIWTDPWLMPVSSIPKLILAFLLKSSAPILTWVTSRFQCSGQCVCLYFLNSSHHTCDRNNSIECSSDVPSDIQHMSCNTISFSAPLVHRELCRKPNIHVDF